MLSNKTITFNFLMLFFTITVFYGRSKLPSKNDLNFVEAEYITENTIRIPFNLVDHLIVIKASVNGKKGNFIIDTGSYTLMLNKNHFSNFYNHRKKNSSGVSSEIDNVFFTRINEFALKTFKIEKVETDLVDLSHIEKSKKEQILGIVGYKVLKDYEIFIDFYLKQITLYKTDKTGARIDKKMLLEKISDSISFKLKKHTIILNCFVNNEKVYFGLDSGAEINQLSSHISKKIKQNFRAIKKIKMMGAGNREREVVAGKLYNVKLTDKIYCGVMRTLLTNLSGMEAAYGTKLDGILGYEFLAMRRIMINYKKEKLYFIEYPFTKN